MQTKKKKESGIDNLHQPNKPSGVHVPCGDLFPLKKPRPSSLKLLSRLDTILPPGLVEFFCFIYIDIKMGVQLPDLKFTSLEVIPERISTLRKSFLENKTRDVEFRLVQLRKLYWA